MRWVLCALILTAFPTSAGEPSHGMAYFGKLKYGPDMVNFDYANPDAPKGKRLRMATPVGSFNNLNPYVDKGRLARWMNPNYGNFGSLIFDPLMRKAEDELASYYCVLCESVEVSDDYRWVEYKLREEAYWHDGQPVTVEDIAWTFNAIKRDGGMVWKNFYRDIVRFEQIDHRVFKFHFSDTAERTPQLVLQTATFAPQPKHFWQTREFTETTLEPLLGNGPYRIGEIDSGNKIVFERVKDYWGKDLNVTQGLYNFDEMELTYFFDKSIMLQALRAGVFDWWLEENEKDLATAYDFPAYRQGLFRKETYKMGFAYGMFFGVVLNQRRKPLDDIRVREALTLAYNFEWANRVLWHNGMDRSNSYFWRSGLRAMGMPSAAELELLEPFRGQIPDRIFTDPIELPENDSFGRNRDTLLRADSLLEKAGWIVKDFERVNAVTGKPMELDFVVTFEDHLRMLVPFVDNLKMLGINARLRRIESNLMTNRLRNYDFDATVRKYYTWRVPIPNRMRMQFTSRYADPLNMTNYAGIKNPVVDFLVEKIAYATSEEELNTAGRALDRVLIHNYYLIPDGVPLGRHVVYWDRLGHPPLGVPHMNWTGFPYLWWFDEEKSARVDAGVTAFQEN
jgi:microcin C transport system substrate-binding protein